MYTSINGFSGYSQNKGIAGLASGMDTESIVKKLLSGTQAKIDKQNAIKQQLTWKQDIYRDVITTLNTFKSTFFDFTNPEKNILSEGFFNTMSSEISASDKVKITATSAASAGNVTIDFIQQLAAKRKETAAHTATAELKGELALEDLKKDFTLTIGKTVVNISGADIEGKTNEEAAEHINSLLSTAGDGGTSIGTAVLKDGKLIITAEDKEARILATGSKLGLSMMGFKQGESAYGAMTGGIDVSRADVSISITLDGVSKTIELDTEAAEAGDADTFKNSLQNAINKAFGNGITVSLSADKKEIIFDASDDRQVTVSGNSVGLSALGIKSGSSTKINLNMKLCDINLSKELQGTTFAFTINGTDFEFSENETLSNVINSINSSDAGVKITYSSLTDKFSIESTTSGSGITIDMEQETGNLLTVLFGTGSADGVVGSSLNNRAMVGNTPLEGAKFPISKGEFKFTLNGNTVTVALPPKKDKTPYTTEETIQYINKELELRFGNDETGNVNISISRDAGTGIVTFNTNEDYNVSFSADTDSTDLMSALGFTETQTGKATEAGLLSDFGLNKGTINIGTTAINLETGIITVGGVDTGSGVNTVGALKNALNEALGGTPENPVVMFDEELGCFCVAGAVGNVSITGADADGLDAMNKLFGSNGIEFNSATAAPGETVDGQNAILSINNTLVERNDNNFSVDGLNFELLGTTAVDGSEKIDINTTRDTDKIIEGIKSFVEEYNNVVDKLNKLIDEEPEYMEYAPLTAEQKEELSEKEIEQWEEKARTGLVRNDSEISKVLSEMRSVLYNKPEGAKYSLFDLGIKTGSWMEKGKLIMPEPPEKLLEAIQNDPGEVQKLFTDAEKGIAKQLKARLDGATKISSVSKGSLVRIAGISVFDTNSTIYKEIEEVDSNIERLKDTYEKQWKRHWSQFNAMEKAISRMNQQSMWLASQFSQ